MRHRVESSLRIAGLWIVACTASVGMTVFAEPGWAFRDVTADVVDVNPPGTGRIFDYAFLDVNDDGRLDIVVNNHDHDRPAPIWLGTAKHRFEFWRNMPRDHFPHAGIHLGEVDLDGNGRTDLICTGNEGGVVANLNESPVGSRTPKYKPIALRRSSPQVGFADFDGDGALEALVRPGLMYDATLTTVERSDLHFGSTTVSDFNGDGWPDLFAAGRVHRRASWSGPRRLFANREGQLVPVERGAPLVGTRIGGITRSGDFDNDGRLDVYVFDGGPLEP